jgi:hypothetical protein
VLQCRHQQQQGQGSGMGNGDHGRSGQGGLLVVRPSPRSLGADSSRGKGIEQGLRG